VDAAIWPQQMAVDYVRVYDSRPQWAPRGERVENHL
jgi:hypothetical protein